MATLSVKVNNVDIADKIIPRSFSISTKIGNRNNSCKFSIQSVDKASVGINVGHSLVVEIVEGVNRNKIFSGTITRNPSKSEMDGGVRTFNYVGENHIYDLNSVLANKSYTDFTITQIIQEIIDEFAIGKGFTVAPLSNPPIVNQIQFARQPITTALDKMCDIFKYSWYIDHDKQIHITRNRINQNSIDADNNNVIHDTFQYEENISQLRNNVFVRGKDVEGAARTDTFTQRFATNLDFTVQYAMATIPTVTVNGTQVSVGIAGASVEADYDCFWTQDENKVSFKVDTVPAIDSIVEITYQPFIPTLINAREEASITKFGRRDYYEENDNILTAADARKAAEAILESDSAERLRSSFDTYETSYEAGQSVRVNIPSFDVNDVFLIQSTKTKIDSGTNNENNIILRTSVDLSAIKEIEVIEVWQNILEKSATAAEATVASRLVNVAEFKDATALTDGLTANKIGNTFVYSNDAGTTPNKATYDYALYMADTNALTKPTSVAVSNIGSSGSNTTFNVSITAGSNPGVSGVRHCIRYSRFLDFKDNMETLDLGTNLTLTNQTIPISYAKNSEGASKVGTYDSTELTESASVNVLDTDAIPLPDINSTGNITTENITGFGEVFKTERAFNSLTIAMKGNPATGVAFRLRKSTTKPTASDDAKNFGTQLAEQGGQAVEVTVTATETNVAENTYYWMALSGGGNRDVSDRKVQFSGSYGSITDAEKLALLPSYMAIHSYIGSIDSPTRISYDTKPTITV